MLKIHQQRNTFYEDNIWNSFGASWVKDVGERVTVSPEGLFCFGVDGCLYPLYLWQVHQYLLMVTPCPGTCSYWSCFICKTCWWPVFGCQSFLAIPSAMTSGGSDVSELSIPVLDHILCLQLPAADLVRLPCKRIMLITQSDEKSWIMWGGLHGTKALRIRRQSSLIAEARHHTIIHKSEMCNCVTLLQRIFIAPLMAIKDNTCLISQTTGAGKVEVFVNDHKIKWKSSWPLQIPKDCSKHYDWLYTWNTF